ncbi:hypothetical protein [Desertimonas flava]|uniref:hypothetical protein n=1 Tax=Desertimonas flava TaxID=2064846 RepID=UPI000E34465C|nr:hypothetical protein [Desertimonas flava]
MTDHDQALEPLAAPVATPSPSPRTASDDGTAFVLGGSGGLRRRDRGAVGTWLGLVLIAAIVALPLKGLYHFTGGTMEEGFMLYFPERIWKGDVPNVDFLHLYGPGALHVLMFWYRLFGDTLAAERTFGLIQHVGIILALFTLARPWGRAAATAVGTLAIFYILTPIGLSAMAWNGGLALTLWCGVFAVRSTYVSGRSQRAAWAVAGFLGALALTYRPDLVIAVGAVLGWVLWRHRRAAEARASRLTVLAGAVVGMVPMWVHLAMAGPAAIWRGMFLDPVFHLRAGRELPRPPSWGRLDGALQRIAETVPPWWPFPHVAASNALFLWFFAMFLIAFAMLGFAIWQRRRGERDGRSTALLVTAIVSVGILPQAWQRPDSTHLTWVTCVSWPFFVVFVADLVRRWHPRRPRRLGVAVGMAAAVVLAFTLTSLFTFRYYLFQSRVSLGRVPEAIEVKRGPRSFYFGAVDAAFASQEVIDVLDQWSTPGELLFVGPMDLSRTWYSDSMFYWMFPELEPATYYIEMDPGLANKAGSRLADDLRSADWAILTAFWAGWDEPNSSMDFGSPEPNQVIKDDFCLFGEYQGGLVRLYNRC